MVAGRGQIMISKRFFLAGSAILLLPVSVQAGEDVETQLTAMADTSYADPQFRQPGLIYIDSAKKARKGADKGDASAMNDLGVAYILGLDVEKDVPRGIALLEKAMAAGCGDAEFNLAELYRTGSGVDKDEAKAAAMYQNALTKGEWGTQLAFMYCRGEGVSQSFAKAVALFTSDAKNGDIIGGYEIGLCAAIGRGVPKSLSQAVFFLLIAVRFRPFPEAEKALSLVKNVASKSELAEGVKQFAAWREARAPIP